MHAPLRTPPGALTRRVLRTVAWCPAAGLLACAPSTPDVRPGAQVRNVLVVTVDTLRADFLGTYGAEPSPTPRLDAFAAESLVFEACYSQATLTNPALTSMWTGLVPPQHGVHEQNSGFAAAVIPVPTLVQADSVTTGSFIANMCKLQGTARTVYHDGWDERFCGMLDPSAGDQHSWDAAVVDAAIDWIEQRDRPFLAWAHLMDPHAEHRPRPDLWDWAADPPREKFAQYEHYNDFERLREIPPADELERLRALYRAEVRGVDEQFGRLLEALDAAGHAADTAVIFTADHGEELFETWARYDHGFSMTEGVFHVPLMVRLPGEPPRRIAAPTELLQVAPTVLELFGLELPYALPAPSLLAAEPSRGYAFSFGGEVATSMRTRNLRYWRRHTAQPFTRDVVAWRTEAPWFELQECMASYAPDGRTPVWRELADPAEARKAAGLLARMQRFYESQPAFGEGLTVDDPELRSALEELGYGDYSLRK